MASSSTPSGVTDWRVGYTLSEPCAFSNIQNSPTIELNTEFDERAQSDRITGFTIRVNNESSREEVMKNANPQAKRLADIMTFRSGKRFRAIYQGVSRKIIGSNPEEWTVARDLMIRYHHIPNIELDLTDYAIAQMIEKDNDINYRLHHASLGIEAEELQLYPYMFTELFQVIEEEVKNKRTIPDYEKYEALRNAISHRQLNPKRLKGAMAQVKKLYRPPNDFKFTTTNEFDYNSQKNQRQLELEAKTLKQEAMSYLNTRM
jgi:hypothetical protein